MPSLREDEARRLIRWTIAMVVLTGLFLWAAYLARGALLLIYVSGILAIGLSPLVRVIERQPPLPLIRRKPPRWLAILSIYILFLTILTAIVRTLLPPLIQQSRELARRLPELFQQAQTYLIDKGLLRERLTFTEAVERAPVAGDAITNVVGAIVSVVGGIFGFLTILIITFYLLLESERLFDSFIHLFSKNRRQRVRGASLEVTTKVSAWLNGQLFLGVTIGSTAAIGLWLLGIPYFFVLALIAGIGEIIPVVGPILSAIPAIGIALTVSPGKALAVALFFIAQQQFENHVLVPKVMQKQLGVPAAIVIIALLIGGSMLGIVGAILAVPSAAVLQVILQEIARENEAKGS